MAITCTATRGPKNASAGRWFHVSTDNSIDLVIFDLGGVLIRLSDGWRNVCNAAGVVYPTALNASDVMRAMIDLMTAHELGHIDNEVFFVRAGQLTGLSTAQVQAVLHARLAGRYDGVDELITQIADTNTRTACLSNTNAAHWHIMTGDGSDGRNRLPLNVLNHRFASHLIGAMKPDTRIYEHVEAQTNTPPYRILFFDDSSHNCAAANARGWRTHKIDPSGDPVTQMRDVLIAFGVLRNQTPI